MKRTFVLNMLNIHKPKLDGFIGVRCEAELQVFFSVSTAVLGKSRASDVQRDALRAQRDKMLRGPDGARLKRELKRINPALLSGL